MLDIQVYMVLHGTFNYNVRYKGGVFTCELVSVGDDSSLEELHERADLLTGTVPWVGMEGAAERMERREGGKGGREVRREKERVNR